MSDAPAFKEILVDIGKVRNYCLSSSHLRGGHKARVFRSRLSLTERDAELLRAALIEAVRSNPQGIRDTEHDRYGRRYVLDFEMSGPSGSAVIRSGWIIRTGEDVLRFVTAYVI